MVYFEQNGGCDQKILLLAKILQILFNLIFFSRALDRFYKRLQATCRLLPVNMHDKNPGAGTMTLSKEGMSLVLDVSKHVCQVTLNKLKSQLGMVS